jgi:hypothetical protein
MPKGQLFPELAPQRCVLCRKTLRLTSNVLHVDWRIATEDGFTPAVNDKNKHRVWVFCDLSCLTAYIVNDNNQNRLTP